jgi:hypothetical protein
LGSSISLITHEPRSSTNVAQHKTPRTSTTWTSPSQILLGAAAAWKFPAAALAWRTRSLVLRACATHPYTTWGSSCASQTEQPLYTVPKTSRPHTTFTGQQARKHVRCCGTCFSTGTPSGTHTRTVHCCAWTQSITHCDNETRRGQAAGLKDECVQRAPVLLSWWQQLLPTTRRPPQQPRRPSGRC